MKKSVNVRVAWYGNKLSRLPENNQYINVAKFVNDANWNVDSWSIVLQFEKAPKQQGNPSIGVAYFLMQDAPWERLALGTMFEFYEGDMLVAKVTVL